MTKNEKNKFNAIDNNCNNYSIDNARSRSDTF